MKYKLINNKTKEETICEKVEIDGFDYYVSDDKIVDSINVLYNNKIYSTVYSNTVPQGEILLSGFGYVMKSSCKKVITTNNPIIDIPKVLCKEIEESFKVKADIPYFPSDLKETCHWWYKEGYNKAKETYQFTEEDMIEFSNFVRRHYMLKLLPKKSYQELLSIWKEQQTKIIFYE